MSTTPASTVADSEQLIADLQRQLAEREAELAEYKAERDEALQRETATAEVLQVVNSSPGDLAPVFDALLERAMHLCGASFGTLRTCDGEHFDTVASRGVPSAFAEFLSNNPLRARPGRISARILSGEPLVHILDVADDELYRSGDPQRRALVELGGARTSLVVSLTKDRAVLGTIQLYRQHVQPFTDKQIALLQNFAAQAVIAMENARLLTETREALEQQTATAEVLQVINSSPGNLQPVFDAMLEKAVRLCGATYGNLLRYDGQLFSQAAAVHPDGQLAERVLSMKPFPPPVGGPLEQIVNGEEVSTVGSIEESAAYRFRTEFREMVDRSGFRSWLNVALRKEGALLGVITVFRKEAGTFSDKQIALLQNFAAQAVIAMENARLITETREALEQQTATADVLGVINSSPGDLGPVFDAMLEKAIRLCDAVQGALWLIDGEQAHVAATLGLKPEFAALLRERGGPTPPLQRVMRGERVIHYLDTKGSGLPFVEEAVATDVRTLLWVALVREGIPLGAFAIARREVRAFTDKEIALLQNFAAQAVIAMENARLLGELRERTRDLQESLEYQTATSDVLNVISRSTADVQPVLDTVVNTAVRLCGADTGLIAIREGEVYRPVASSFSAAEPEFWAMARQRTLVPGRNSIAGRVALEGRVLHVEDLAADPDFAVPEAVATGRRTQLGVPLLREGAVLGSINLNRKRVEPFTERQIELVRTFADQAVIAIENARLLGELRQRTDEVADLNRGLQARVAEQVEELGRVGRLKRFLAPQLAELIVSQGDEKILESHRREIVVVFCDLRGYTAFTETAEPEEVLDFLREYHGALGPLVSQFEGTLDQFSGDGIMVFFNDPVPIPDPAARAVRMAMAMREAAGELIAAWRPRGCDLGFGAGIAWGYATLGQIGFSDRSGYTAIGTVCNLAARLCDEAKDGQILVSGRVAAAVGAVAKLEDLGTLELKGLSRPVAAFNIARSSSAAEARPNLTVVGSGPAP